MPRCSPPLVCRKSTSFFYKVLMAIKRLQSSTNHRNGVDLTALVEFLEKHHNLTGDTLSQVRNALKTAESRRLVFRPKGTCNLFKVVPPAAVLHTVPAACVKDRWEDLKKSFEPRTRKDKVQTKKGKGRKAGTKSRPASPCRSESNSIVARDPDWYMNEGTECPCNRNCDISSSSSDSC